MKYLVYPITGDDCDDIPTWPEPMPLAKVSEHIEQWLSRYKAQGYYRNAKCQRVELDSIAFRIEPHDVEPARGGHKQEARQMAARAAHGEITHAMRVRGGYK